MCDFEDQHICGFTNDHHDNFDWTWKAGRTSSVSTGPPNDHTVGTNTGQAVRLCVFNDFVYARLYSVINFVSLLAYMNHMFVYLKLLWIDYKTPSEPIQVTLLSFLPQVTTCTLRRAVQDTAGTVLGLSAPLSHRPWAPAWVSTTTCTAAPSAASESTKPVLALRHPPNSSSPSQGIR